MRKTLHGRRFLRAAGVSALVLSGTPALLMVFGLVRFGDFPLSLSPARFLAWLVPAIVFGAAFWQSTATSVDERFRRRAQVLLLIQTVAALVMVSIVCTGLETMLLMVVAAQLGLFVRLPFGVLWLLAQLGTLFWIGARHAGLYWSLGWTLLSLPFAVLALLTSYYAASEARARHELARANAELRATQQILAESSRTAERARISRELHDLVGHHLAALSLNLEAARHLTGGKPREQVEKCQSLTRQLLADVRDVVRALRPEEAMDLARVLEPLIEDIPHPKIHLAVSPDLAVTDPDRAHALVRCVQEIITNSVKHAGAENLWIELRRTDQELEIHARDDGRGAPSVRLGHGLTGMRERLERLGGQLDLPPRAAGFELNARIPVPEMALGS